MLPDCVWISTSIAKPNEIIPVREWLQDCTVFRRSAFARKNQYTRHTRISLCNSTKVNQDFHKHEDVALRSTSLPETRRQRMTAAWFVTDFTAVRVKMLGQRIWLHLHRTPLVQLIRTSCTHLFSAHPYHQYQFLLVLVLGVCVCVCCQKGNWEWFIWCCLLFVWPAKCGFYCWPKASACQRWSKNSLHTFISHITAIDTFVY